MGMEKRSSRKLFLSHTTPSSSKDESPATSPANLRLPPFGEITEEPIEEGETTVEPFHDEALFLHQRLTRKEILWGQFCPSYYRVPDTLLQIWGTTSFKPQFVAIGPTHRKDASLKECWSWKQGYMHNLFLRVSDASRNEILESCLSRVYSSLANIKLCYGWTDYDGDDTELANMIVEDACFIIEFMIEGMDYVEDPGLGRSKRHAAIMADLLLLGNQIPFFALNDIFECTVRRFSPGTSLVHLLLLPIMSCHSPFERANFNIKSSRSSTDPIPIHHILSLVQHSYKPQVDNDATLRLHYGSSKIPSALDLDIYGLKFEANNDAKWVLGMEVKLNKPVLKMPIFHLNYHTERILKSIIAYEQQVCAPRQRYITSYVNAIGMLGRRSGDVDLMANSGVLVNFLGSDDEAVTIIQHISKQCVGSLYEDQWQMLDKHRTAFERRRTFFGNPWNLIALALGIILLVFKVKKLLD